MDKAINAQAAGALIAIVTDSLNASGELSWRVAKRRRNVLV